MSKNWFWWRALATLILVVLLIAGGVAVHYLGWSRGYAAGQLATGGEEAVTPPSLPYGFGYLGWRPVSFVFGAGMLFVLGLLFFAVISRLVRFVIWGAAFGPTMAGPWSRHWHRPYGRHAARWHRMHGPVPPWYWGWDEPDEAQAEEADTESDAES